jgi:hypothetical protein
MKMKNAAVIKNNISIGYDTLKNSTNPRALSYLTKNADKTNANDRIIRSKKAK